MRNWCVVSTERQVVVTIDDSLLLHLVRSELKRILDTLLGMLEPRQSQILRLYFGMEDGTCHSLQQIADKLGISKERTRQIKQQAMDKLQKLGSGFGLEEFL